MPSSDWATYRLAWMEVEKMLRGGIGTTGAVINVCGLGAYADGTNASTTTAAIQAAVDALNNTYGGTIFFPPGKYLINDTINLVTGSPPAVTSGVNFLGSGQNATFIQMDSGLSARHGFAVGDGSTSGLSQAGFARMSIRGPAEASAADASGIHVNKCEGVVVYDCHIRGWREAGVRVSTATNNQNVMVAQSWIASNKRYGVYGTGGASHLISLVGNIIESNGTAAGNHADVHLNSSNEARIVGNNIFSSTALDTTGIWLANAGISVISGNLLNGYGRSGIRLSSDCSQITITGNTIYDPAAGSTSYSGIMLESATAAGSSYNVITGNYLRAVTLTPDYGIQEDSNCNNNLITGNLVRGFTTGVRRQGAATIVRHNHGHTNENVGTGTIAAGNTSVSVNHGLHTTPTRVVITPTATTGGRALFVSAKGATTFTVSADSSLGTDMTFDWYACTAG